MFDALLHDPGFFLGLGSLGLFDMDERPASGGWLRLSRHTGSGSAAACVQIRFGLRIGSALDRGTMIVFAIGGHLDLTIHFRSSYERALGKMEQI